MFSLYTRAELLWPSSFPPALDTNPTDSSLPLGARGEPARSRRPLGLRRARQTPQEGGERPARRGRAFRARRAPPPPSRRLQRRCPPAPPRPRKSRAEEESPGRRRPSAATSGRCRPAGPRCSSTRRHVAAPGALPAAATHRPHRARPHGVLTVPPAASHGAQPRAVPTAAAGSLGRPACPCHPWLAVPVLLGLVVAATPSFLGSSSSGRAAAPGFLLSPQQPRLPAQRSRAGSPERAV